MKKMSAKEHDWPCELRHAHGPHEGRPGVKAHPATMIGRRPSGGGLEG